MRRQFTLALAASDADQIVGVGWAGSPTSIQELVSLNDADLMFSAPLIEEIESGRYNGYIKSDT